VLVAGFSTRHVAQSARRAGYTVYAVDHFCDQDLSWYTEDRVRFDDLDELHDRVVEMCRRHPVDMLVATSGAEAVGASVPLCGTRPESVGRFLDKLEIQRFFEGVGVPVPPIAEESGYPVMIKPRRGAGGWRNAIVRSEEDLRRWKDSWPDVPYITQQVVDGTPASVSCIADGARARAIAVNEQLLRDEGEGAYGFSGSITPFRHPLAGKMVAWAERIAAASGCIGSVGIDFMVGEETWAIEINPRFQATLDTVEMALGKSVFQMHVDACRDRRLPDPVPASIQFSARRILFAEREMELNVDLSPLAPRVADIPWPGTRFEEGNAVVSVYGWGRSRDEALRKLDENMAIVRRYMERSSWSSCTGRRRASKT